MNKILILSIIFFLSNCSFDTRSGIWTEDKKVKRINKNVIQIFKNKEKFLKEFNSNLVIKLSKSFENKNYDLTNNSGI